MKPLAAVFDELHALQREQLGVGGVSLDLDTQRLSERCHREERGQQQESKCHDGRDVANPRASVHKTSRLPFNQPDPGSACVRSEGGVDLGQIVEQTWLKRLKCLPLGTRDI
jgi:hypothetical protein